MPRPKKPHENVLNTQKQGKLPDPVRRELLKRIAWYWSDSRCIAWLKDNYGLVRSEALIRSHYRQQPRYQLQIQKYRDKYNAEADKHPLNSKSFMLDLLKDSLDDAQKAKDFGGIKHLTDQILKITGMRAPENLEINHTVTGGITYEHRIKSLLDSHTGPPPDIIDVKIDPRLLPGRDPDEI